MTDHHTDDTVRNAAATSDQQDYLLKRAADHRGLALKAADAGTRTIHLRLQKLYEERAERPETAQND